MPHSDGPDEFDHSHPSHEPRLLCRPDLVLRQPVNFRLDDIGASQANVQES